MKKGISLAAFADDVIDMYVNKRMTTVDIARYYNCSDSSVGKLLEKHGIPRVYHGGNNRFSQEEKEHMKELYAQGYTTIEIGEMFHCCDNTVAKYVRKQGGELRRGVRRSHVQNHNYFHTIDTPAKAYFLGWMITDGCVVDSSRSRPDRAPTISIELHSRDKYIIDLFAQELGASVDSVHIHEKRNHAYFRFASQEMADDLAKYGVVFRKSLRNYLPTISDDLMPHLLRGIFDGNGTVTLDKRTHAAHVAYYGSEQLCLGVRQYLHDKLGMSLSKVSKSTCYHVWWSKRSE